MRPSPLQHFYEEVSFVVAMTNRERLLAIAQGRELDRVPFIQYDGIAAPNEEIWPVLGRNNMGLLRWSNVHRFAHPHCHFEVQETEQDGRRGRRTILHTPAGQLVEECLYQATYNVAAIRQHYIRDLADYRVFMAYLRDIVVLPDVERFWRDYRELGDDGLPLVAVERTPFQQLWIQWVSLEDLCAHMADDPDLVEECIGLLAQIERQVYAVVRRAAESAPIPFVDIPDNITAPVIGLRHFKRYCLPLYQELSGMLAERGVPVFVHMDGYLKPLWSVIGETGIGGIDSLSPPPDNDTSAGDVVRLWPGMRVFLNFPSSVHIAEPAAIYEQAARILAEAGHSGRLSIQISENVPPGVWRRSFPEIVRAIDDFGRP